MTPLRVLVLGASGMLGSAVTRLLGCDRRYIVAGTVRGSDLRLPDPAIRIEVLPGVDVLDSDKLIAIFAQFRPHAVINCVGVVKQKAEASDPLATLPINSILPHRLAGLCHLAGARMVHISTDCVFSGAAGQYKETDVPDATDLYGRSKLLGEVIDKPEAVTLRTSIIGPELSTQQGLLQWFLAQSGRVEGYSSAIFSGLPTVVMAETIRDHVLPNPALHGLYHVSSSPINKLDLLKLFAEVYEKRIEIVPNDEIKIDRSLDSTRYRSETGFTSAGWRSLVFRMRQFG